MTNVIKKLFISVLILTALLFAAVYVATPYLVRYYAALPLADYGLKLNENSHVTYNLLTSTLSVDQLTLVDKQQMSVASIDSLDVSLHLYQLIFKRIKVSDISLAGGYLLVEKQAEKLSIAGIDLSELSSEDEQTTTEETQPAKPSPYKLLVSALSISDFQIQAQLDGVEYNFLLDDFALEDLLLDQTQQSFQASLISRLGEATLSVDAQVDLQNQAGQGQLNLNIDGLALAKFSQFLPDSKNQLAGTLSLDLSPSVSIQADSIDVDIPKLSLEIEQVSVSAAPWLYQGEGHAINAKDIKVSLGTKSNAYAVAATIDTQLEKGKVFVGDDKNMLASWQSIHLSPEVNLSQDAQQIEIAALEIAEIKLSQVLASEASSPLVEINRLALNQMQLKDNHLAITEMVLSDATGSAHVQANKSLLGLIDLTPLSAVAPANGSVQPADEETEPTQPFGFSLQAFRLVSPAVFSIRDESVNPPYAHTLELQKTSLGVLDSRLPEQLTPFELSLKDDEYLALELNGGASIFAERLNAEIKGKLTEINLPQVSPYVKDSLGFEMKSGQLDVDIDVEVEQDQLGGDTTLVMRGLEMTKADDYEQGAIKEGQAMPLNVALNLLKDGQGNIDLNVPISGDISDPSFGISSFITLVLKKAAMSQAKSYLLQTFVPYANVVSVVMSGADYLLKLRLEPLNYEVGQQRLVEGQMEFMQQLSSLMQEKADVQIKTCAISTPSDIDLQYNTTLTQAQTEQLVSLGNSRQTAMKSYLVDKGIASSRVLSCTPEIDLGEDAQPRVELNTD